MAEAMINCYAKHDNTLIRQIPLQEAAEMQVSHIRGCLTEKERKNIIWFVLKYLNNGNVITTENFIFRLDDPIDD